MTYELIMGLEVHVELSTASKLFCSCSAQFGADANMHACPACAGMPGMLPRVNKRAIELGVTASLLTNCAITSPITFDKKNYFYPDLPNGYQITQWFAPVGRDGYVEIVAGGETKRIGIKQIHIEEDAGKLVHDNRTDASLADYNRVGVPLIEIVSQPDFRTAYEVTAYLEQLRSLLAFAGVSDCRMQEGSMRCDVNISVRPVGSQALGTRAEIKNMNSLKAIARAIPYEYERQVDALGDGETLVQETRRWDDARGQTLSMRNKENATDYRYFPNPDVLPIIIDEEWINHIKESTPESAQSKNNRLRQMGLSAYDSDILTGTKALALLFDDAYDHAKQPKDIANWIIVEVLGAAKEASVAADNIKLEGRRLARLIALVQEGAINRGIAREILIEMMAHDTDPDAYIAKHNLAMVSDIALLEALADETLAENPKSVAEYQAGNQKVMGFLIGKVMKKTEGKADPKMVASVLENKIWP